MLFNCMQWWAQQAQDVWEACLCIDQIFSMRLSRLSWIEIFMCQCLFLCSWESFPCVCACFCVEISTLCSCLNSMLTEKLYVSYATYNNSLSYLVCSLVCNLICSLVCSLAYSLAYGLGCNLICSLVCNSIFYKLIFCLSFLWITAFAKYNNKTLRALWLIWYSNRNAFHRTSAKTLGAGKFLLLPII